MMTWRTVCVLAVMFATAGTAIARKKARGIGQESAYVPAEIRTAKTIFISNVGNGCNDRNQDSTRVYSYFYREMQKWGRYGISELPSGADMNFEIGISCLMIRLVIRDMRSRAVLWTFSEHLVGATFNNAWERAVQVLVKDLKQIASPPKDGPLPTLAVPAPGK